MRSSQTKDYKISVCCLSAKHTATRSKIKDWLAPIQNNVSEWSDMSTSGLLFQRATTIKTKVRVLAWHKADIIIISLNATDAEKLFIWLHSLPSGTSEFTPDFSGVCVSSILSFLCIALALSTIVCPLFPFLLPIICYMLDDFDPTVLFLCV